MLLRNILWRHQDYCHPASRGKCAATRLRPLLIETLRLLTVWPSRMNPLPSSAMATPIRIRNLFRFWLPLQATWLMMACEGPLLAAVIARLAEPKHNLAAYGVAFALAILVEAPVIMMMSAATALVDSSENYRRLRLFTWSLNLGTTVALLALLLTPAWSILTLRWMGLDPDVARLAHQALLVLLPWPAAIGFRRFCQGLLIRAGLTRRVAWGTMIRLVCMAATALVLATQTRFAGSLVGACALSAGVIGEAIASRMMTAGTIRKLLKQPTENVLSYRAIIDFYTPLALTSTIALAVQPMVTFFMGQARFSLESLAVLPVINALVFIFRTPGLSYQEVAITMLARGEENRRPILRFAVLLGALAALGLALIAWTPLSRVWFQTISGLSPELAQFTHLPIRILVLMPLLSVLLSLQRALLVSSRHTQPITWASVIEVGMILAVLAWAILAGNWVGATAAAAAFMVGRFAANGYLLRTMRKR
jgi:progressive ankylosis protein